MTNFKKIENKWQKKWEESKIFQTKDSKNKKKHYILEMFPYPSGSGLHMGHAFNYTIGDIFARFKRMQGYNILHPMGYDSFGLPAENAAIKAKSHPKKYIEKAIKNYIKQQKSLGISYDWSRMVTTSSPDYYKWDQWIFLKLFEKGLAYKKKSSVNWCPKCNTVLANEQVQNGKCWRHEDTDVEVKTLSQWFFKITEYADELYDGIPKLKQWPENIKKLQKNWIKKSFGTEIKFKINNKPWKIFTTRPDTLYGVTFMVISAQHPRLMEITTEKQKKQVEKFTKSLHSVSEQDIDQLEKQGVFTGAYATHPLTKEKIPIYAGNFVLADYGSGMVMAVPAHDQRDFEFAKKYKIPIKVVITPKNKILKNKELKKAYTDEGKLINSDKFNNLNNEKAKQQITKYLIQKKLGKKTKNFRLKDWLISRQRFWGTPIPIVYCDSCGLVPVKETSLPVTLPEKIKLSSSKNPLTTNKEFLNTTCPKCGKPAKRETDTMDTFTNSSWYFLRYCDTKNKNKIFDKKKANYWCPIDTYIGGKEHACMHLIYIRFYTKFLRDIGLLNFDEPAIKLFTQGMLHGPDREKMSKSKGNVVLPETVSKKYGIDTARLFLVSIALPDKDIHWDPKGVEGSLRFINKLIDYTYSTKLSTSSSKLQSKLHQTIKEVTENIQNFKYNFAVMNLRELLNSLEPNISKKDLEDVLKLLSPFCPHVAEELWEKIGNIPFISSATWPKYHQNKIKPEFEAQDEIINSIIKDINSIKSFIKTTPKTANIFISEQWKYPIFKKIKKELEKTRNFGEIIKAVMDKQHPKQIPKIIQSILKDTSKLPLLLLTQKQELELIKNSISKLQDETNLKIKINLTEKSKEQKAKNATPHKPAIILE